MIQVMHVLLEYCILTRNYLFFLTHNYLFPQFFPFPQLWELTIVSSPTIVSSHNPIPLLALVQVVPVLSAIRNTTCCPWTRRYTASCQTDISDLYFGQIDSQDSTQDHFHSFLSYLLLIIGTLAFKKTFLHEKRLDPLCTALT